MSVQEGVPPTAPPSPAPSNVQRIMPVLYVNQSNIRPASPAPSPSPTSVAGQTIITAVPHQIQLTSGTNTQIIHSSTNPSTYSYVPMRQVYHHPTKTVKDPPKKVYVTSINSNANNKSNQVNFILPNPNTQASNQTNKPITSLILPQLGTVGTMTNKGTITGMILPNNSAGANVSKPMASLLLQSNTKYPNIAPNKKLQLPNIILPQQNVAPKPPPNIIRQSNNPSGKNVVGILSSSNSGAPQMTSLLLTPGANSANKQPPTSMGLILPTSGGTHSIIVSQAAAAQTPTHSLIMPQSSGVMPPSTGCQTQVTNLILAPNHGMSASNNSAAVANLLISSSQSSTSMGSLLMSQSGSVSSPIPMTGPPSSPSLSITPAAIPTTTPSQALQKTSIIVPVSLGPSMASSLQPPHLTYPNTKKTIDKCVAARDNKQSVLVKAATGGGVEGASPYPNLPPLQPIGAKALNVPETLVMTPISDSDFNKNKIEKISDEMTIERTSSVSVGTDEKGTSTTMCSISKDDKLSKPLENDLSVSRSEGVGVRGEREDGVVLDGEVTVRRLGPHRREALEKRKLDDEVKIEIVKPERQKLPPPRYQKPEDLDPMDVLQWDHQGVGKLPGSNIKFRMGEFGLDLVVDSNKDDSSTTNTPNSSRRNSDDKPQNQDTKSSQDLMREASDKIYCCEGCGCYGLYSEFLLDTRFCSVGCKKIVLARNELRKKKMEDKIKEIKIRRKRRKIKILPQGKEVGTSQKSAPDTDGKVEEKKESVQDSSATESIEQAQVKQPSNGAEENNPAGHTDTEDSGTPQASEDEATDKNGLDSTSFVTSAGEFMWAYYLVKHCNKAKAAPVRLFRDPFPYGKNGFKVGMKLEGIDPEHQAIISVLTVAQVRGHRVRLHFDGYPDCHDFWANSDSSEIFPPGWCEKNNHTLHPPRGYSSDNFNWNTYLKQCRAQPAPRSLFPKSNAALCPSQFRVGMKLEAVDRKHSSLICVSTVADLIDSRILIHFDSWSDEYDYWTDPSSPYIHPVGWCQETGNELTPPNTFKNPSQFSWDAYLKETKSQPAPSRAFKPRPPNAFKRGMRLEAVDKRSPTYLRPATVREVKDFQIRITFDGFMDEFGYWVDDDSPDIHPTGWGHKTGHPVTPPPLVQVKSECGTEFCTGEGNIKGGFMTRHTTANLCPYAPQNLNRENLPDRFCDNPDFYEVPEPPAKSKPNSNKSDAAEDSSSSDSRIKTRYSTQHEDKDEVPKVENEEKTEEKVERRGRKRKLPESECRAEQLDKLRRELIQSVLEPGPQPPAPPSQLWAKHVAGLGNKVSLTGGDPRSWNHKQVAAFVNTVIPSRAKLFLDQEVDGESFLMMEQADLTKVLELKLGPALKIYNCIILLRKKVMSL